MCEGSISTSESRFENLQKKPDRLSTIFSNLLSEFLACNYNFAVRNYNCRLLGDPSHMHFCLFLVCFLVDLEDFFLFAYVGFRPDFCVG